MSGWTREKPEMPYAWRCCRTSTGAEHAAGVRIWAWDSEPYSSSGGDFHIEYVQLPQTERRIPAGDELRIALERSRHVRPDKKYRSSSHVLILREACDRILMERMYAKHGDES